MPTPIQVLLVLFSKEKNKKTLLQANLSFYLCTKGQECELHHLESDDAVGDADDGDTASDACEEVIERELPADEDCPEYVRDYVLSGVDVDLFAKGRERELCYLEALNSERYSDNSHAEKQTEQKPHNSRYKSAKYKPDDVSNKSHNNSPFKYL